VDAVGRSPAATAAGAYMPCMGTGAGNETGAGTEGVMGNPVP